MEVLTIVSLIVNAILIITLFFKSALNDILVEHWKEKKKAKKDRIDKLNELKTHVNSASMHYTNILTHMIMKKYKPELLQDTNLVKNYEEAPAKLGVVLEDIFRNEIYYPAEIKQKVDEYRKKNADHIIHTATDVNIEEFYKILDVIQKDSAELVKLIDNYLSKNI